MGARSVRVAAGSYASIECHVPRGERESPTAMLDVRSVSRGSERMTLVAEGARTPCAGHTTTSSRADSGIVRTAASRAGSAAGTSAPGSVGHEDTAPARSLEPTRPKVSAARRRECPRTGWLDGDRAPRPTAPTGGVASTTRCRARRASRARERDRKALRRAREPGDPGAARAPRRGSPHEHAVHHTNAAGIGSARGPVHPITSRASSPRSESSRPRKRQSSQAYVRE
ncbi:hypothetical protein DB32_001942 [Sandaracinus amylolyticus]|uniref:Uncharacterized protein n=1 Tax=Sandaracinus amylolyticus TaxID=927083 RepID=A0A0F6W147_9BACT|nr:hypothetical protein DB32_001942 [Sandaracinus amylolyticus]